MEEAPSEEVRPPQGSSRGTLIPSGFESVAHPVFFRIIDVPPDSSTPSRRRRREASSTTSTTTIGPTATAARNLDALETESDLGLGTGAADRGAGSSKSKDGRGLREVPSVCPICLEKFEQPVTLTSCLHTFCHTCILGWYEHTVAVALSRGDLSAFSPESGANLTDRGDGNRGGATAGHTGRSRANKPYRCPLCQVPGPFFLAVERPSFKTKTSPGFKPTKLKFKLLGARTVFGGGGEKSGGVTVDEHSGGGGGHKRQVGDVGTLAGYPSPGMADLRAAARTQHALAAAAAREARAQAKPKPEESPLLASAGRGGEATAGGDKAGVGTKPSDVRAAQHVANGDQGVSARSIGREESSSNGGGNGGGSSGRRASGADGDPAGDTAAAERGGGIGGSTDRTRVATGTRLEDGSQLPLDRGEEPSHDGGNRESNQVTPHPGRGNDRERDRRKGRRRRRSEERSDSGLDFRDVFPVVGGSASEGSRGQQQQQQQHGHQHGQQQREQNHRGPQRLLGWSEERQETEEAETDRPGGSEEGRNQWR
ncbi:unnamed protein product [Scytosiphon promiscuus]